MLLRWYPRRVTHDVDVVHRIPDAVKNAAATAAAPYGLSPFWLTDGPGVAEPRGPEPDDPPVMYPGKNSHGVGGGATPHAGDERATATDMTCRTCSRPLVSRASPTCTPYTRRHTAALPSTQGPSVFCGRPRLTTPSPVGCPGCGR